MRVEPGAVALSVAALARVPDEAREAMIARMDDALVLATVGDWPQWARGGQVEPPGDWRIWLMLAGRGYGKTRAGAEWVRAMARTRDARIALVGATMADARAVMVEGASGVLAVHPPRERPAWEPSLGRLRWASGAVATLYSGENPDGLRGPEFDFAWCDELAKWAQGQASWDNLMFALRAGDRPRAMVTTTPRPIALLRRIRDAADAVTTGGRSDENPHVAASFLTAVRGEYGGTRLGRQELDGELLGDVEGALWTRGQIEGWRVAAAAPLPLSTSPSQQADEASYLSPEGERGFVRIVVGVDPPAGSVRGEGDACGIVVVGLDRDKVAHVLADASVRAASPEGWARAVARAAAAWGADRVVAEANNGGKMVASVLRAADVSLPLKLVHASHGKVARAEPVAALYEAGRVRHAGCFPQLEDEMCGLVLGGGYEGPGRSPDRADALVWALSELMLGKRAAAVGVRVIG